MWEKEKKTMQVKETENKSVKVEEMTGREINDYFTPRDPGLSFAQTH